MVVQSSSDQESGLPVVSGSVSGSLTKLPPQITDELESLLWGGLFEAMFFDGREWHPVEQWGRSQGIYYGVEV